MKWTSATIITLLASLLLLAGLPAHAGQVNAVLNGKSFHLGASEDLNENNYGLGIEYEFANKSRWRKRLMVNGFQDSSDNMSYMAGGGLHRNLFSSERLGGFYVDAGINVFLMTRRDLNDNRPTPGVLPSLTVGNRHVGMNLTYLPRKAVEKLYDTSMQDQSISGIIFLQFKVNMTR